MRSSVFLKCQLWLGCILGLYLAATSVVMADYEPPLRGPRSTNTETGRTYYRPPRGAAPTGTRTGGRRGICEGSSKVKLTTLAPTSYVGQTLSTHPTFAWFMPVAANEKPEAQQSYLLEFRLYKTGATAGAPFYKTTLRSTPGMMTLSLPQNAPALLVGQQYEWWVILLCDPSNPSRVSVAQTTLQVVPAPSSFSRSFPSDAIAKATQYAAAGLWYDAFGTAVTTMDARAKELQRSLLEDLLRSESANNPSLTPQQRQQLEQQQERLWQVIQLVSQPGK